MEVAFTLLLGAILGFAFGQMITKDPGETEMFNRLVRLRANRKIEASSEAALDKEIEDAADKIARS